MGKTRKTQLEFDVPVVHVWTFSEGRIVRFEPYIENGTMLAALEFAAAGVFVFPVYGITANGMCECGESTCEHPGKHPRTTFEVLVEACFSGRFAHYLRDAQKRDHLDNVLFVATSAYLAAVFLIHLSPIAHFVPANELLRSLAGFGESDQTTRCGNDVSEGKARDAHDRSRKPASLAVARNCGMGSSSLNAEVKALDRLQSVRGSNSG